MPLVGRRELAAHVDHHHQPAAALLFDVIVCRVMGDVAVDQPLAVTQRLPRFRCLGFDLPAAATCAFVPLSQISTDVRPVA